MSINKIQLLVIKLSGPNLSKKKIGCSLMISSLHLNPFPKRFAELKLKIFNR